MGSIYSIRLQTVICVQSGNNYQYILRSLHFFDHVISEDTTLGLYQHHGKTARHIEHLFGYKLAKEIDVKMDKYVYDMFDAYCKHKKEIKIHLRTFDEVKHLSDLFIHSYEYNKDVYLREDNDKANLLQPGLAKIFPNVIKVVINAWGASFSLIGFLNVLKISNWQTIKIQGDWIHKLAESSKWPLIVKQYESSNYKIELKSDRLYIHAHHP